MRSIPYVVGFLALLVVADFAVGHGLLHLHQEMRTTKSTGAIRWALDVTETDLLVLGSSRAKHHVDTNRISDALNISAINMGENGQGIIYARMIFSLMVEKDLTPRVLLLQVGPKDLAAPDSERATVLAPFFHESEAIQRVFSEIDPWANVKFLSRSYSFNHRAISIVRHALVSAPAVDSSYSGFEPLYGRFIEETPNSAAFRITQADPLSLAMHDDLLREALERGVQVILFEGPRLRHTRTPWDDESSALFKEMALRNHALFFRWDEQVFPDLQDAQFWKDTGHLNGVGAARFTEHILQSEAFKAIAW